MYTIDQNTESTLTFFNPGINENCELVDIKFEAMKEGSPEKVLRFIFAGANGEKHTETLFPINKENTIEAAKRWGRNPEEVLQEESAALAGKIQHIMTTFIPKEQAFISAKTWDDFCQKVITAMGTAYKGVKVRLKFVLNTKDYLMLPKKAKAPFIQKMSETNTLRVNPKWDKVTYSAKNTAVVADPFETAAPAGAAPTADPFAF